MGVSKYKKRTYHNTFGNDSAWFRILTLAPLAAVIGLVPLLVRASDYTTHMENYDFFDYAAVKTDIFLHSKMILFLILSFIMFCLVIAKLYVEKKNIRFSKVFIPLGVYAALALLSSIFSKYQPIPWTGAYEMFESIFVLLGYVLTAYYGYLFINDKKDMNILIAVLTVCTVPILAIGISQAFFTDFFQTDLGCKLIGVKKDEVSFTFEEGRVFMTLYNPNYVGSYAALLSPLFLMMIFAVKNIFVKLLYGGLYVAILLVLFGSGSRAGFIGIGFSLLGLLIIFMRRKLKFWIPVIAIGLISFLVLTFYLQKTGSSLIDRIKNEFNTPEATYSLTNIETNDNDVVLTYLGNNLHIQFSPDTLSFNVYDDSNETLPVDINYDDYSLTITDERFKGIKLQAAYLSTEPELIGFAVYCSGVSCFANIDNSYYFRTPYGKFVKCSSNPETVEWLEKHGTLFSKRGYIWAKSIPLLKRNIILGSGADTFVFEFPNNDFLSMRNGGFEAQIMTKPHNMYLQIGVQTGVFSLIAVLVFYVMYLVISVHTIRRLKKHNFFSYISGGIGAGSFGYMITQLINDSSVAVAPLFWGLIGIGFAACFLAKQADDKIAIE